MLYWHSTLPRLSLCSLWTRGRGAKLTTAVKSFMRKAQECVALLEKTIKSCMWAMMTSSEHRYLKKSRLLKFSHVPVTSAASSKGIFAAVITWQRRRTVRAIYQTIFLRCLCFRGINFILFCFFENYSKDLFLSRLVALVNAIKIFLHPH